MNIISCPQIVDNFLNKEKGLTRFVSILFNQVGEASGMIYATFRLAFELVLMPVPVVPGFSIVILLY